MLTLCLYVCRGVVKSSSGESITTGISNPHPYRLPQQQQQQPGMPKYDSSDFPLRKTGKNYAHILSCTYSFILLS